MSTTLTGPWLPPLRACLLSRRRGTNHAAMHGLRQMYATILRSEPQAALEPIVVPAPAATLEPARAPSTHVCRSAARAPLVVPDQSASEGQQQPAGLPLWSFTAGGGGPIPTGESIMGHFSLNDVRSLESPSVSPGALKSKIGEMITSSTNCRAKVEAINPSTGEYRVVIQGTLDKSELKQEK